MTVLDHTPYSPDLAPADYFFPQKWNPTWKSVSWLDFGHPEGRDKYIKHNCKGQGQLLQRHPEVVWPCKSVCTVRRDLCRKLNNKSVISFTQILCIMPVQNLVDALCIANFAIVSSYGIGLCSCASKSKIVVLQRSQSKILRTIANASLYVKNHTFHTDFNIPYVSHITHDRINEHHIKLEAHPIPLLEPLLQPVNNRRLKRCWPFDLQDTCSDIAGWTRHHDIVIQHHISLETVFLSDC